MAEFHIEEHVEDGEIRVTENREMVDGEIRVTENGEIIEPEGSENMEQTDSTGDPVETKSNTLCGPHFNTNVDFILWRDYLSRS